jgi:transcriptional regulator with PAS, ATPase and Fis domain
MEFDFFKTINGSITVSDTQGNVLYMNDKAAEVFGSMVGQNMMGCHGPNSQQIIERLMANAETNAYTIEKGDVKKIIYQTPWYNEGEVAGLVEFSFVIPFEMPHYVRQPKKE